MRPGVYYSAKLNMLDIVCEACNFTSLILALDSGSYEYIGEFWNESAELERYRCAIDIAKRNFKQIALARCSIIEALEFVDIFNEEIEQILNAEVQDEQS